MHGASGGAQTGAKYHCPMHPQIVSNEPGECPICHMNLEPIVSNRAGPASAATMSATPMTAPSPARSMGGPAAGATTYYCPMHPHERSDHAGRCPVCKMDLEVMPPKGGSMNDMSPPDGHAGPVPPGSPPPGTTPITLTLDRIQVDRREDRSGRRSEHDADASRHRGRWRPTEQGVAEVHVRSPGFVEQLVVNQTGIAVGASSHSSHSTARRFSRPRASFLPRTSGTGSNGRPVPRRHTRRAASSSCSGCRTKTSTR